MKSSKRKLAALFLTGALALASLSGCGALDIPMPSSDTKEVKEEEKKESLNEAETESSDEQEEKAESSEEAENIETEEKETEEEQEEETTVDDKESEAEGVSGTFTGEAVGQGGESNPVKVTLTLENGKIKKVEVDGPGETPGIGTKAIDSLPGLMEESNSLEVDAVAGATITSKAIIAAATSALAEAGLEPSDLEAEELAAAEPAEDEIIDCDIVIVGMGGAGMTAAITAADAGKSVVILESQPMAGGNSVRATGGLNAAGTEEQDKNEFTEADGVEKTLKTAEEQWSDNEAITALAETVREQFDAYNNEPEGYFDTPELMALDTLIGGHGINDPDLVKTLTDNSAGAITWLHEHDADLDSVGAAGGASVKRIHRPLDANGKTIAVGAYIVPILEKNVDDRDIEVRYETTAKKILMEEGKAVGIEAEGASGNIVTVNAKAVILATGGFGSNTEMIEEYRPDLKGFVSTNASGALGQGIEMATAEDVGADTVDLDQIQIHPTVHVDPDGNAHLITEGVRGDGAILVNKEGVRFYDEVSTRDKVSAAEMEQTDGVVWLILDQTMIDGSAVYQGYLDAGYSVKGESYEELAEAMDVPKDAFLETMEKWALIWKDKKDDDFGRTSFSNENDLSKAPFYAIPVTPGIHHTMGGLKINSESMVLDKEGVPIPGLFAAGEVTGGVHGGNRLGGTAVTDIIVFGQIAGNSAAAYVE